MDNRRLADFSMTDLLPVIFFGHGIGDGRFAASVRLRSDTGDDIGYDLPNRGIICGFDGDEAVSVEPGLGEELRRIGRVLDSDHLGIRFTKVHQDLSRRGDEMFPLVGTVINGGKRQFGQNRQRCLEFREFSSA
jgi:hypothetical protein